MKPLIPQVFAMLVLTTSGASAQNAFIHWESPHVSPIALSPDGTRLVAVNTADHRIEIYAVGANGLPQWQASVPVGLDPVSVRLRSNSEAWVVNHLSDTLSIVDLGTRQVVKTISTGDEPADVVFAGTPQRAFVTLSSRQQLQVFDAAAPAAALNTLALDGREPRALAVSQQPEWAVCRTESAAQQWQPVLAVNQSCAASPSPSGADRAQGWRRRLAR